MAHLDPASSDRLALDPALLELIACPDDHQALSLAPATLVERINAGIATRALRQRDGALVETPAEALLVTADGARAYPVRDGVAELLIDTGILLTNEDRALLA